MGGQRFGGVVGRFEAWLGLTNFSPLPFPFPLLPVPFPLSLCRPLRKAMTEKRLSPTHNRKAVVTAANEMLNAVVTASKKRLPQLAH